MQTFDLGSDLDRAVPGTEEPTASSRASTPEPHMIRIGGALLARLPPQLAVHRAFAPVEPADIEPIVRCWARWLKAGGAVVIVDLRRARVEHFGAPGLRLLARWTQRPSARAHTRGARVVVLGGPPALAAFVFGLVGFAKVVHTATIAGAEAHLGQHLDAVLERVEREALCHVERAPDIRERLAAVLGAQTSLSVSEAARLLHMSTSRLRADLRERGHRFTDERNRARVLVARALLEQAVPTPGVIGAIGRAVGIASPSHFTKVFRRYAGTWPSACLERGGRSVER